MTSVLAPEERRRGREIFTRNLMGPPSGSGNRGRFLGAAAGGAVWWGVAGGGVLRQSSGCPGADGERITMEVSGVPLEGGGHVIGVFGQVKEVEENQPPPPPHPSLTPRHDAGLRPVAQGQ